MGYRTLKLQHSSMQFTDNYQQKLHDAEKLFGRGVDIMTGTEAGEEPLRSILREQAQDFGYRIYIAESVWVAVNRGIIKGGWDSEFVRLIDGGVGYGPHGPRGIASVSFNGKEGLGRITVGSGHLLTNGRQPRDPNYKLNTRMTEGIADWGTRKGRLSAIVFYAGDQNIPDNRMDTFRGGPFLSIWDELKKYEDTGHGNIDVIARYNKDKRVKGTSVKALDDKEFFLCGDHKPVVARYQVKLLGR